MDEVRSEELMPAASRAAPQVLELEPSVLPEFAASLRGYDRAEVHAYLDEQRRRLAAMRLRAQVAEQAIAELRQTLATLQHLSSERLALPVAGKVSSEDAEVPGDPSGVDRPPAAEVPERVEEGGPLVDDRAPVDGALPVHGALPEASRGMAVRVWRAPAPVPSVAPGQGPQHARRSSMVHQRSLRRRRLARYAVCSAASIALTEALLAGAYGELRLSSAELCSLLASIVAAVPTFFLYRAFVWRIRGRSHLRNEVVPFGVVTAIGLGLSTLAVALATALAPHAAFRGHLSRAAVVDSASMASFGVLFVLRFFVLDRFVFVGGRHLSRS